MIQGGSTKSPFLRVKNNLCFSVLECKVIRPVYLQQSDIYKTTQSEIFSDRSKKVEVLPYSSHWFISIIVVGRLLGARAVFFHVFSQVIFVFALF